MYTLLEPHTFIDFFIFNKYNKMHLFYSENKLMAFSFSVDNVCYKIKQNDLQHKCWKHTRLKYTIDKFAD